MKRVKIIIILIIIQLFGLKMEGYGQQVFSKTYGHFDFNYGKDVMIDSTGLYILGNTGFDNGNSTPMLIRTDTAGIIQKFSYQTSTQITAASKFYKIHDKLYVCGNTNNIQTNDYDCFLSIYDTSFTLIKTITYGGNSWDFANDINGFDTLIYVVGQTYSTPNGFSWGTISKFNLAGDSLATYYYGTDGEASIKSIIVRGDSELIFTGWIQAPDSLYQAAYVASTNKIGVYNWNKNLSADLGKSVGNDLATGLFDKIVVCGSSEKYSSSTLKDPFIYVINSNGDYNRHQIFNETSNAGDDEFTSITSTSIGDYYISGNTNSYGLGALDILLFKINFDGWFIYSASFGQVKDDISSSIKYSPLDSGFVLCGSSTYFGDFNSNIVIIKTDKSMLIDNNPTHQLSVETTNPSIEISAFPNPTTNNISIKSSDNIKSIELFDIRGQKIQIFLGNNTSTLNLDLSKFSSQIYIAKITTKFGIKTLKISKL